MLSDRLISVRSSSRRCVQVQMILKDFEIHLLEPGLEKPRLPKPGQVIGAVGAAQILYCRILSVGHIGSECGRRTKAEILSGRQHPRLPGSGERSNRRIAAPHPRCRRKGAVEW